MKTFLSMGSILLASIGIVWGVYLIKKNTPQQQSSEVRFSPPMNPSGVNASTRATGTKLGDRYIGGVGIVEPAGEAVTIGSQIPGVVSRVLVEPGDRVEEGAALFHLDDRLARANVGIAASKLAAEEAILMELFGKIAPQQARVDAALAQKQQSLSTLTNAQDERTRAELLVAKNAISSEEFGQRRLALDIAKSQLSESEAMHREALASLELLAGKSGSNPKLAVSIQVQQAAVEQAQASLVKEQVTLDQHNVLSPKAGTVLQVKVRKGEYAPAAVLANPLIIIGVVDPLHLRVDIDESEIPRFHASSKAYASVRGNPEARVPITYVRTEPYVIPKKSLNGGVSERVDTRVMQIIYSVSPQAIQAVPGQQVDVYIEENKSTL